MLTGPAHKTRRPGIRDRAGERGSVTVFTAVFAVAVVFLLGLILDGGMALNAKERAMDIAGQAARAAADDISLADLRAGGAVRIDVPTACPVASRLVTAYAAGISGSRGGLDRVISASMPGCGISQNQQTATVTVQITTTPLLPGVLGGFTESATESATVRCGITQGGACG